MISSLVPGLSGRVAASVSWLQLLGSRNISRNTIMGGNDLAPEKRLPRLMSYSRFWRIEHVGQGSGAIHA